MPRFMVRVLIFTTILAGLLLLFEHKLSSVSNIFTLQKKYLEQRLSVIEWCVLGNSVASSGIDPDTIAPNGFNLGNGGQEFYYDKQLMLKYIDRMPRLKTVMIVVTHFSLWHRLAGGGRASFYSQFYGIPPESDKFD